VSAYASHELRAVARPEGVETHVDSAASNQLIAIVAHELRGPLVPIRNIAALLKRGSLDALAQRRAAELLERQVGGMIRLLEDLVDVSQLRSGNLEIQLAPVLLGELIERCVEIVGSYVSERGHRLIVDVMPGRVSLLADSMRICQALQNLITNAAKYSNRGGEVRIRAHREGDFAVIVVSDQGIGLSVEQLKTLFDMFAQVGQAGSRRSEGGLGIGLFLTRNLVEAHGGSVAATSAGPGLGSEFTVRLPCVDFAPGDTA